MCLISIDTYRTRKNTLRCLSRVFQWAYNEEYLKNNYSSWVPAPSGKPTPKIALDPAVVPKLLKAASKTYRPLRNQAIIAAIVGTGMRRTEAAELFVSNIALDKDGNGHIRIESELKGSDSRTVAIDPVAGRYIRAYIDWVYIHEGPLFPGGSPKGPWSEIA